MKKALPKCPECKGTGEHKQRGGPTLICTECNGTGEHHEFEMIFWPYDQFPFVLASRGFLLDTGWAYCPSYNTSFKPIKVMPLKEGTEFKAKLDELEQERKNVLQTLDKSYRFRLHTMAPWAVKKPS